MKLHESFLFILYSLQDLQLSVTQSSLFYLLLSFLSRLFSPRCRCGDICHVMQKLMEQLRIPGMSEYFC